jgi:hypothetical protein
MLAKALPGRRRAQGHDGDGRRQVSNFVEIFYAELYGKNLITIIYLQACKYWTQGLGSNLSDNFFTVVFFKSCLQLLNSNFNIYPTILLPKLIITIIIIYANKKIGSDIGHIVKLLSMYKNQLDMPKLVGYLLGAIQPYKN